VDFKDVLKRRRAVRTYDPRPVPRDVLERITNAAVVRAPSAGFSQGLRLVVVTDPAIRREIAIAAGEDEPGWGSAAPVHVVVFTREDDYHERYQRPDKLAITDGVEVEWPAPYWYVDAGAAIMTLMLGAINEGLASAIFGVVDVPAVHRVLGIPDDVRFVAVVTMGYAADADPASSGASVFTQRRKPRAEVVRWERWES
jgi:FMN reductase [NAD(P)H]